MSLLAGCAGGPGNADGTGATGRFNQPYGVAIDSAGNVFVADSGNGTIRKVTPAGVVTTLAGTAGVTGSADGTGAAAQFNGLAGVATDSSGNIYAADARNSTIRKVTPAGVVTTLAGTAGVTGSADGTGAAAQFAGPTGVATDSSGNIYVADSGNLSVRKISPAGVVTTLAVLAVPAGGSDPNNAEYIRFNYLDGIATDGAGNVYVTYYYLPTFGTSAIFKVTPAGVVSTLVSGRNSPEGIATDSAGNIYVTDFAPYMPDSFDETILKITPAGVVTTLAGTGGVAGSADGTGVAAQFDRPLGIATDRAGNLYVADSGNDTIRNVTPAGVVTTLAGAAAVTGSADGAGAAAHFNEPSGIATDSVGNIYVADSANSMPVQGNNTIRKITPAGVVTTLAGTAGVTGSADGTGAAAQFDNPIGVATDSAGNIYVADCGNGTIRRITTSGVVTTLAGTADVFGSADGTGPAAQFSYRFVIATDSARNIYAADAENNTIRKVSPAGVVTTLAGTAGVVGSADGTGSAAQFNQPTGIGTDSAGNIYVADTGNSTIRKVTPAGVVTTLAGTAGVMGSADGTGAAAQFDNPIGVATDSAGNIYVADSGNGTIRQITASGVVGTIVGQPGVIGFSPGDLPGVLAGPFGVALFGTTLYVTSYNAIVQVMNVP